MVIERIDYYDEELGHRWASVDVRLVLKLWKGLGPNTNRKEH